MSRDPHMPLRPKTEAERRLLTAVRAGEPAWMEGVAEAENLLRAALIRDICLFPEAYDLVPPGLQVVGVETRIDGTLDLEGVRFPHDVSLIACRFEAAPILRSAHLGGLYLSRSHLPGLTGDRLTVEGDLFLRDGFSATGPVRLAGASVGGNLECDGATLDGGGAEALFADGLSVGGSMFLRDGFSTTGPVRLLGASIGGNLECGGASLDGGGAAALHTDGLSVGGGVFLRDGFSATGPVRLLGASIGGDLDCVGATLDGGGGAALFADGLSVGGGVFLRDGFSATGPVRLPGASIGGGLVCIRAILDGRDAEALIAETTHIKGNFWLWDAKTTGKIHLYGARVDGTLEVKNSHLGANQDSHKVLWAENLTVGRTLSLRWTDPDCCPPPQGIIDLRHAHVGVLDDPVHKWYPWVSLVRAGKDFDAIDRYRWPLPKTSRLEQLEKARQNNDPGDIPYTPTLPWPEPGNLLLDGFTYDTLGPKADTDWQHRLAWLRLQPEAERHKPQPYEQLSRVLKQMGHLGAAREIRIAKMNALQRKGWLSKVWGRFVRHTVAYGYKPWLALWWALGTLAVGMGMFYWAWTAEHMCLTDAKVYTHAYYAEAGAEAPSPAPTGRRALVCGPAPETPHPYTPFNAGAYAVDVLFPFVDLYEEAAWAPTAPSDGGLSGFMVFQWFYLAWGWLLSAIFVAGITGLVKSDKDEG